MTMTMTNNYSVTIWGPSAPSRELGDKLTSEYILTVARNLSDSETIQVNHPSWKGGYVCTWDMGGASCKYFPGHDDRGFGGDVPEEALELARALDNALPVPEEEPASWRREPFYGGAQWHHPDFGCVEGRFDPSQVDRDCDHWVAIRPGQEYSNGKGFPTEDQAMDYLMEYRRLMDEVDYYRQGEHRLDGLLVKQFLEDIANLEDN